MSHPSSPHTIIRTSHGVSVSIPVFKDDVDTEFPYVYLRLTPEEHESIMEENDRARMEKEIVTLSLITKATLNKLRRGDAVPLPERTRNHLNFVLAAIASDPSLSDRFWASEVAARLLFKHGKTYGVRLHILGPTPQVVEYWLSNAVKPYAASLAPQGWCYDVTWPTEEPISETTDAQVRGEGACHSCAPNKERP